MIVFVLWRVLRVGMEGNGDFGRQVGGLRIGGCRELF